MLKVYKLENVITTVKKSTKRGFIDDDSESDSESDDPIETDFDIANKINCYGA